MESDSDILEDGCFFLTAIRIGVRGATRLPSAIRVRSRPHAGGVYFHIELH